MAKKEKEEVKESQKFIAKIEANLNGFDHFNDDDKREILAYLKSI